MADWPTCGHYKLSLTGGLTLHFGLFRLLLLLLKCLESDLNDRVLQLFTLFSLCCH